MEENVIEQPQIETETDSEIFEQPVAENQEGSIYGKFKDAKNLIDAYNSLQGEFTRKSQKLAEIQKKYNEIAVFSKNEESLDDVLKNNTDSVEYKKEIEEMLAKNENISNLPNKYQVAFKIINETERKVAEHLNNQDFMDKYINTNEKIKNDIISNYLSNLNNISFAPKVISGNASKIHFSPNESKPKTLKDAGEIFSKMLK